MSKQRKLTSEEFKNKKEKYDKYIASSLAGIIRISLDDDFREKCFKMLEVDNTNAFEAAVRKKLDLISEQSRGLSRRNVKSKRKAVDVNSNSQTECSAQPPEAVKDTNVTANPGTSRGTHHENINTPSQTVQNSQVTSVLSNLIMSSKENDPGLDVLLSGDHKNEFNLSSRTPLTETPSANISRTYALGVSTLTSKRRMLGTYVPTESQEQNTGNNHSYHTLFPETSRDESFTTKMPSPTTIHRTSRENTSGTSCPVLSFFPGTLKNEKVGTEACGLTALLRTSQVSKSGTNLSFLPGPSTDETQSIEAFRVATLPSTSRVELTSPLPGPSNDERCLSVVPGLTAQREVTSGTKLSATRPLSSTSRRESQDVTSETKLSRVCSFPETSRTERLLTKVPRVRNVDRISKKINIGTNAVSSSLPEAIPNENVLSYLTSCLDSRDKTVVTAEINATQTSGIKCITLENIASQNILDVEENDVINLSKEYFVYNTPNSDNHERQVEDDIMEGDSFWQSEDESKLRKVTEHQSSTPIDEIGEEILLQDTEW